MRQETNHETELTGGGERDHHLVSSAVDEIWKKEHDRDWIKKYYDERIAAIWEAHREYKRERKERLQRLWEIVEVVVVVVIFYFCFTAPQRGAPWVLEADQESTIEMNR